MRRRTLTVIGALLLGGCGGADGPSRSEYIARADAICESARERSAVLVEQVSALATGPVTPEQARKAATAVGELQELGSDYVSDLRALERPSDDKEQIDAFLGPAERVVDAIGDAEQALNAGQLVKALSVMQAAQPLDAEAASAAKAYGFKQCGSVVTGG